MSAPFEPTLLATLLPTLRRRDWTDTGALLDHFAEHGDVVLTLGPRTESRWGCAWRPTGLDLIRVTSDNPHVAVRQVAEAALAVLGSPKPAPPPCVPAGIPVRSRS